MMPRQLRVGSAFRSFPRRLTLAVLGCPALSALVLGSLRFRPVFPGPAPTQALARHLRPFQRRLWRRRGTLLLLRLLPIALASVVLLNLVRLWWLPNLPALVRVMPAVLVLAFGCWLLVAQRPTPVETARLLDRWFRLRDQLGTAVEAGPSARADSLAGRQVEQATELLGRLPRQAWTLPVLGGRERLLLLALIAGAAVSAAIAPSRQPDAVVASSTGIGRHQSSAPPSFASHPQPLVAHTGATMPARHGSTQRTGPLPGKPAPAFVASLQMRTGPQLPPGTGASAAPHSPENPLGVRLGNASGDAASGTPSGSLSGAPTTRDAGNARSPASGGKALEGGRRPGGQGAKAQQGGQGGAPGQSTSQSGAALGNPQQGADSGTPGADSQGNQPAQPQQSSRPGQSQQGNVQSSANPFGQGDRPPSSSARTGNATKKGAGQQSNARPAAGNSPAPNGASSNGTLQPGRNTQPGGDQDPTLGRRGRGSTSTAQHEPSATAGHAGPARGPQIDLGGHVTVANQGQGSRLVEVAPLGGAPPSALIGSNAVGPSVVQGYVPEDATHVSLDDQALIRAYFSYGSGS